MKVVLVMFKDGQRREFPVSGDKTILGRRTDSHLRIPTRDVSRQHCALLIRKNSLVAKDLGSSNGTFVNDKRIAEITLKAGDRLRIGPVTFIVQIDGVPDNIKPKDVGPAKATVAPAAPKAKPKPPVEEDEETFDLSDADFDLDALGGKNEDDDFP